VSGVVREATIAALLTGLILILLFLGSWRSTVIVCLSIPLSILTSLIVLGLIGETINVMTLGGLALAVGILVDRCDGRDRERASQHGDKRQVPGARDLGRRTADRSARLRLHAVHLHRVRPGADALGGGKILVYPLSMAVVFAMLTSYLLTRTVVPTLVHYLLPVEIPLYQEGAETSSAAKAAGPHLARSPGVRPLYFEKMRDAYHRLLDRVLEHRVVVGGAFAIFAFASLGLVLFVGRDFFPYVDSGQMRLHVRCPTGTRIEEVERIFGAVEEEVRRVVPPQELDTILDNIGLPNSGINLAFQRHRH